MCLMLVNKGMGHKIVHAQKRRYKAVTGAVLVTLYFKVFLLQCNLNTFKY